MYLMAGGRYYVGSEQRARRAPFLLLVVTYTPNGTPLGKRSRLRAFVRSVALHQCGHFMMGRANIGGKWRTVSGTYGADGLPMDVDAETWRKGIPVPRELERAFWKGNGHNSAGSEGEAMFRWGKTLLDRKQSRGVESHLERFGEPPGFSGPHGMDEAQAARDLSERLSKRESRFHDGARASRYVRRFGAVATVHRIEWMAVLP